MLQELKDKLDVELAVVQLKACSIEDAYRMQTVIDDHMRRMEELEKLAKEMVAELEGK